MMRHGTDEARVPGDRAMDGHIIERVAGATRRRTKPALPDAAGMGLGA